MPTNFQGAETIASNRYGRSRMLFDASLTERNNRLSRIDTILNAVQRRRQFDDQMDRKKDEQGAFGGAAGAAIGAGVGLAAAPFTGGATLLPGLFSSLPALTSASLAPTLFAAGMGANIGGAFGSAVGGGSNPGATMQNILTNPRNPIYDVFSFDSRSRKDPPDMGDGGGPFNDSRNRGRPFGTENVDFNLF